MVKNPPAKQRTGSILGQEDALKKEMATYSSIFAWEIHSRLSPWDHKRVRHNLVTKQQQNKEPEEQSYVNDLTTSLLCSSSLGRTPAPFFSRCVSQPGFCLEKIVSRCVLPFVVLCL